MAFQVFDAYGAASRPEATFRSSGYLFLSRGILKRAGNEKATHAQLMFDEADDRLGIRLCGAGEELAGEPGVREMVLERSGASVTLVPLLRYFGFPEAKAIGKRVLPVTFEKGLIVTGLEPLREARAETEQEVKALPAPSEEIDDDIPF